MTRDAGVLRSMQQPRSGLKFKFIRHVVQAQILILLVYGIFNPAFPIKLLWKMDPILAVSGVLVGGGIPYSLLLFSGILLLSSIIAGRFFCGWICPLGFIFDLTSFSLKKNRLSEGVRYIKYAIFFGGTVMLLAAGWTFLEWLTPLPLFSRTLTLVSKPDNVLVVAATFLLALTFSAFIEKRAWCRYICPLGAVLSLSSAKKAFGIKIEEEKCSECLRCEKKCTMNVIDVKGQMGLRWNSECISCLECRDACPVNAISFGA